MEHLPDPAPFLREAHRLLKDDGKVAITVPNYRSLTQRLLGRRDRYVCVEHLNYFTRDTAGRLMERNGFTVERTMSERFNPVVAWQDFKGVTLEGASVERQVTDQGVTDRFKYGGGWYGLARRAHGVFNKALTALGLGDLLYVLGRKRRV